MGFDVLLHTDLTDVAARAATENFKARLRPGSEALFYFSGHGAELRGVSYLIPVNASPNDSESRFRQRALSVTQVLEGLSEKSCSDPALNQTWFGAGPYGWVWTSTDMGSPDGAVVVHSGSSLIANLIKKIPLFVRRVK
jgi:hypothetical protein